MPPEQQRVLVQVRQQEPERVPEPELVFRRKQQGQQQRSQR
jgi:hypothetical protein